MTHCHCLVDCSNSALVKLASSVAASIAQHAASVAERKAAEEADAVSAKDSKTKKAKKKNKKDEDKPEERSPSDVEVFLNQWAAPFDEFREAAGWAHTASTGTGGKTCVELLTTHRPCVRSVYLLLGRR